MILFTIYHKRNLDGVFGVAQPQSIRFFATFHNHERDMDSSQQTWDQIVIETVWFYRRIGAEEVKERRLLGQLIGPVQWSLKEKTTEIKDEASDLPPRQSKAYPPYSLSLASVIISPFQSWKIAQTNASYEDFEKSYYMKGINKFEKYWTTCTEFEVDYFVKQNVHLFKYFVVVYPSIIMLNSGFDAWSFMSESKSIVLAVFKFKVLSSVAALVFEIWRVGFQSNTFY